MPIILRAYISIYFVLDIFLHGGHSCKHEALAKPWLRVLGLPLIYPWFLISYCCSFFWNDNALISAWFVWYSSYLRRVTLRAMYLQNPTIQPPSFLFEFSPTSNCPAEVGEHLFRFNKMEVISCRKVNLFNFPPTQSCVSLNRFV